MQQTYTSGWRCHQQGKGTQLYLLPTSWLSPCMANTAMVCYCVHEWVNVWQYRKALWVANGYKNALYKRSPFTIPFTIYHVMFPDRVKVHGSLDRAGSAQYQEDQLVPLPDGPLGPGSVPLSSRASKWIRLVDRRAAE